MKTKGQKGFAIVNIIVGVILVMASFAMFGDPSVGPGGIISLALGGVFWGVGAWALSTFKKHMDDEARVKKARCWNLVCFIVSVLVLAVCTVLPILGSVGLL
ncbi:hypothetical protein SDC9_204595 [bioreactor metagenome]|uniref:Uncharacterized protein n=1 Tax=bioreactor metagenome TaxID=1076179 RepID=A0A645J1C0_9ZZZZ|nr:hypothetical protein [Clostridia bacterium]